MRASSLEVALERGPVPAEPELVQAVAEPGHDQPVAELEHGPVVAEPGHGRVAVELELVQEAEAPEPDHRRAQLAVALRTKSVIAAHHHGLVPVLRAEDLAVAAAETTREPAAPGEVVA